MRLAAVALVWPLALRTLGQAEIVIWQVMSALTALVPVADFGVAPVLIRLTAARGNPLPGETTIEGDTVERRLSRLARVADWFYARLTWVGGFVIAGATVVVWQKIRVLGAEAAEEAWFAWALGCAAFWLNLSSGGWSALLQGGGELARVRRVEIVATACGVAITFGGLWTHGGLLPVAAGLAARAVVQAVFWRRRSARLREQAGPRASVADAAPLRKIVWQGAWRSGVGIVCSAGLGQASALVVAAFAELELAAAYLIGWRLLGVVGQFSQAPFYSRLPEFGGLAAAGDTSALLVRARRAMAMSLGLFVSGHLVLSVGGPWLLERLGAAAEWPTPGVWWMLGAALFLERYGAMHLQLDTLGHKVRWHVANGGAGAVAVAVMATTLGAFGLLAVPLGLLAGQVVFYCPYAVGLSRRRYGWRWREFDWPAAAWAGLMALGGAAAWIWRAG